MAISPRMVSTNRKYLTLASSSTTCTKINNRRRLISFTKSIIASRTLLNLFKSKSADQQPHCRGKSRSASTGPPGSLVSVSGTRMINVRLILAPAASCCLVVFALTPSPLGIKPFFPPSHNPWPLQVVIGFVLRFWFSRSGENARYHNDKMVRFPVVL